MYFVAWKVSSRIGPCQISLRETPAKLSPASSNYTRVLFLPNYNPHHLITLHCIMASDKRKAPDAFGSTQLVKRTKTPVTEGGSAISIINSSASNGALIQAVCRWGGFSWRCEMAGTDGMVGLGLGSEDVGFTSSYYGIDGTFGMFIISLPGEKEGKKEVWG